MLADYSVLRFNEQGLIPAIVQDVATGRVLMLAYMNREALERTLTTASSTIGVARAHSSGRRVKRRVISSTCVTSDMIAMPTRCW